MNILSIALFSSILLSVGCQTTTSVAPPASGVPERIEAVAGRDNTFNLLVTIDVPESQQAEFEPIMRAAEAGTRLEPGNLDYVFLRHDTIAGRYVLQESWQNLDALEAHFEQPYVIALLEFLGESQSEIVLDVYTPAIARTAR